ncbi:MAG: 50S ribosomal protein L32 [Deltaproteobacteria bacterium]|nr:50S ribosomal protein L32 [Deltaproteobacteria bacterium]
MAVPKQRVSKTRRNKRRAHDFLTAPQITVCPHCGEPKLAHRVCPSCGMYKGRQVIQIEEE